MTTAEVQWSELQRDPKAVAALAEQGPVRVRRRDGAPLLLIQEGAADAASAGAIAASRALRSALAHLPADVAAQVLVEEFPWVDVLPPEDRARFGLEFARAVGVSAELGKWSHLAAVLREWKATAQIHADPELHGRLTCEVDGDLGPVTEPTAT